MKNLESRVSPRAAKIIVSVLVLGAGIAEFAIVPGNIVVPIIYPAAVAACLWTNSVRVLWATAAVSVILAVTVHNFAVTRPITDIDQIVWINRVTAIFTTVIVALFVDRGIRTHLFAELQMLTLGESNTSLSNLNEELTQREEEIVRQNEELQSQTEELERQTEELRVTNEELAIWERRLEQLLELSRSLTASTKRGEVFGRICESLEFLLEADAAALLIREGDELQIECHHGFGEGGPRSEKISYHTSFASQVIHLGQTGYVEDIRLRPDLRIPQPQSKPEFRAVLATPLRVDGRTVGTIEAYAPDSRSWTSAEIAIIESLAIQAGKSIQESELMEAVQFERRRFEAALKTVPVGMAIIEDPMGRRIRINSAAAAIFELASDENISTSTPVGARLAARFVGPAKGVDVPLPFERALQGEEIFGVEYEFRSQTGRRISLLTSAAPIFNEKLEITGAVAAFVDISTQKTLERELDLRRREAEEASLRKTRFLAAVSHDIRTPANAVNLMAEIIRRLADSDSANWKEIAEIASRLQANIHLLLELINDLLDVARFDTGKMELSITEFSLADLISQEVSQVTPLAYDKGIELESVPLTRPIWLRSDRVKLGRVLGNLLGNSIKFTEKGKVRISAEIAVDRERQLLIKVEDTGIGIAAEHLDGIFDEFAQVQNPARDRSKGAGLGLAICKRIVELLDGFISVKSRLGEGTTFTVELPASAVVLRTEVQPAVVKQVEMLTVPKQPLDLKILLIEDHTPTRDSTARLLRDEGATVHEAHNGTTGLDLLQNGDFEVALLDMMLPDIDGREILRSFQAVRPNSLRGILVLTGDLTEERLGEIKKLGADGFISKPVDLKKLLHILHSFRD